MTKFLPRPGTKLFEKGKSGNPEGRPKRMYKEHIEELRAKGYKPPTRGEYHEMIGLLLAMTEDDLKIFAADNQKPYWIRMLISDLGDKRIRQRVMADYRDWLFGKAKQETDLTVNISDDLQRALEKAKALRDVDSD